MVSRKNLENTHRLGDRSHLPLLLSLLYFSSVSGSPLPVLKIHVLLAALAVAALIDLKIQLRYLINLSNLSLTLNIFW